MRTHRLALVLLVVAPLLAAEPSPPRATFASVRGCEVGYRVFDARNPDAPTVLIAHGYLRNGEHMRGWAQAIVANGLNAVTVDLCASNAPEGRHADNARDLVALRKRLELDDVIYLGTSAGGLAALLAAAQDGEATRGVLLLDPTNAGGQARAAATRVRVPVAALVSRPQMCNAWRNIDRALKTLPDATIVSMGRVSHCDFEWPSDSFCRVACFHFGSESSSRSQARIHAIALDYLRALAAGDTRALARWKASIAHRGGMDDADDATLEVFR
ncbi:MAG TPA: hypothetical protein VNG69_15850 [Casimicrobiaceae bacterium]|nr:hypothetical protein [Casimicrobiaceae bacterium]